ncbi:hypothetical protein RI543_005039 [Arxiozyma heterogenica]|uniref:Uncharacterized protein n=1 Tax=Arxiozyma heterogenica TaxID=278026 RepID=A0AAN7WRM7_9SACH|nr:hypothetical protein RI543_005039 [Kazachstania heterogenica]
MEVGSLSSENIVLLYVLWSWINYSDSYINELSDPNPKIYYTNSVQNTTIPRVLLITMIRELGCSSNPVVHLN